VVEGVELVLISLVFGLVPPTCEGLMEGFSCISALLVFCRLNDVLLLEGYS
jgi:hypothetical protein